MTLFLVSENQGSFYHTNKNIGSHESPNTIMPNSSKPMATHLPSSFSDKIGGIKESGGISIGSSQGDSTTETTTSLASSIHSGATSSARFNLGTWHRYGVDVDEVYEILDFIGQGHMGEVIKVSEGQGGGHITMDAVISLGLIQERWHFRVLPGQMDTAGSPFCLVT